MITEPSVQQDARRSLLAKMSHTTDVCTASRTGTGPLSEERLAEIRDADARTCGADGGFFNGYSMTHVDRHDLLRHIDAITKGGPAARQAGACIACGCTADRQCEDGCERLEGSLELVLCTVCAWAIARDAVEAGVYRPAQAEPATAPAGDGALF